MKTLKITISFITLWLISSIGFSQNTVSYGYDTAGNRISRIIVMPPKSATAQKTLQEESTVVYSEQLSDIEVKIYPNPTDGLIRVDIHGMQEGETANINLFSLSGSLIVSKQKVISSTEINITGQATGVYILKIVVGDKQTEWKIIKK